MNFEKVIMVDGQEQVLYSFYKIKDEIGVIVDLYIYNELFQPGYYTEIFQAIRDLGPDDNINVYINSPGGDMNTLLAFEYALNNSDAVINCYITGEASSAAGILAFLGDNLVLSDYATIMLHNTQISDGAGDTSEISKNLMNTSDVYKRLLERYCDVVLSPEDIKDIIENGKTFYFTSNNITSNTVEKTEVKEEEPEVVEEPKTSEDKPEVKVKTKSK